MNRRRWIGLIVTVTILTVTGWYAWSPIAIACHKFGIALADGRIQAINVAEIAGTGHDLGRTGKWYARRVHHCDRLVALGYFFHESYQMDKLPNSPSMHHAVLNWGMNTFPIRPYWSIGSNEDHIVIDVYDFPEFKSQWDAFAQKHNDAGLVDGCVDERGGDAEQTDEPERIGLSEFR